MGCHMIYGNVTKIFLAQHKVDFRKSHNGLLAESFKLNLNVWNGDCILFLSKNKTKIKILYADKTGLWLSTKIFSASAMKTKFKFLREEKCDEITRAEMAMLFEGARFEVTAKAKEWSPQKKEGIQLQ